MFDLESQASAIVTRLEQVGELQTVAYIDEEEQSIRHPGTTPAAFVTLAKVVTGEQKGNSAMVRLEWTVVVKGRQLQGPGGCLPVLDLVADALGGFVAATGAAPLMFAGMEMLERRGETIDYAVNFTTGRQAVMPFIR